MLRRAATYGDVILAIEEGRLRVDVERGVTWTRRPRAKWRQSATEIVRGPHQAFGYARFSFASSKGAFRCLVHRAVWFVAHGPLLAGEQVNHRDGVKLANGAHNLEAVSGSENQRHARHTGLRQPTRGERHSHQAKLTPEAVREIRASTDIHKVLAARYGITQGQISRVRTGKAYAWVV